MSSAFPEDLPIVMDEAGYVARATEWGTFTVCIERSPAGEDLSPLFDGLPESRCQCEHIGYLVKGKVIFRYSDRDETVEAGQVYHARPGHLPLVVEEIEAIEFTRTEELKATRAVVAKNIEAGVRPVALSRS